ncbi:hypothetical protein TRFO_08628 [Tritrichomonas foetus]|uniref:Uncharacterized protein n=1 Tax=Tritrichomonas foetus TaxID=1144522 RepID=A0A1J4JP64_9EUKA|nr:hypothetical protein TRFO_08628 [Tritrichomonas foetus]|eukprot:OHS99060.1 hypothetical protein TRFO_08628 [Tritrichomonas foetus]
MHFLLFFISFSTFNRYKRLSRTNRRHITQSIGNQKSRNIISQNKDNHILNIQEEQIQQSEVTTPSNSEVHVHSNNPLFSSSQESTEKVTTIFTSSSQQISQQTQTQSLDTEIIQTSTANPSTDVTQTSIPQTQTPEHTQSPTSSEIIPTQSSTPSPSISPSISPFISPSISHSFSPQPPTTDSTSTTPNQYDEDADEERKQKNFMIAICLTLILLIGGIAGVYIYCRKKYEEEQNPEYTRAILGDDAFEFSQLQTL